MIRYSYNENTVPIYTDVREYVTRLIPLTFKSRLRIG